MSVNLRTGLSSLPFAGPLLAVYNLGNNENLALVQMNPWLARTAQDILSNCDAARCSETKRRIASLRTILEESRLYAIGGAIGAVLTIALTIKLLAPKVFLTAAIAAPYSIFAIWCLVKIGELNWHIREYQNQKIASAIQSRWPEGAY